MADEIPTRPYLIRAIYEWAVDNAYTPQLLVDVGFEGVQVPPGYAQDGRISLNIHPDAVRQLELGKEWISFSARFSGQSYAVRVPVIAVQAIFARESGRGFYFQDTPPAPNPPSPTSPEEGAASKARPSKGPSLKIVK